MRSWHAQKRYLQEHYRNLGGVRFRPTGEPLTTVQTSSGPLEFTSLTRLYGLTCLVTSAAGDPTVGNAIDELQMLRYSKQRVAGAPAGGRYRVRQQMFGIRHPATRESKTSAELEAEDEVWPGYLRALRGLLKSLRADTIKDEAIRTRLGRHGMVLGLHAQVERYPGLAELPTHRHSRLGRVGLPELLEIGDPAEISADSRPYSGRKRRTFGSRSRAERSSRARSSIEVSTLLVE